VQCIAVNACVCNLIQIRLLIRPNKVCIRTNHFVYQADVNIVKFYLTCSWVNLHWFPLNLIVYNTFTYSSCLPILTMNIKKITIIPKLVQNKFCSSDTEIYTQQREIVIVCEILLEWSVCGKSKNKNRLKIDSGKHCYVCVKESVAYLCFRDRLGCGYYDATLQCLC